MLFMSPFAWFVSTMLESVVRLLELVAFLSYSVWFGLMSVVLALVEGVNELLPEYDLVDNAVGRASVMGVIGLVVGFILMIFLTLAAGLWCIPFAFFSTTLSFAFLGVAADPGQKWGLEGFSLFGTQGGPKTPLNL